MTSLCESLRNAQSGCEETLWFLNGPRVATTVELVRDGQIERREISPSKPNRLSVTEKCSLVMKKVTFEDVGRYTCRHRGQDSQVELSVVIMTEQKDGDNVTLNCYVSTYDCRHKVKWLYQGQDVDKNTNQQTSQSDCQATLSFLDSHFISPSRYKLLTCEVTNDVGGKVEFSFRRQTSGDDKTPATTKPTRTTEKTTTGTRAGPDPPGAVTTALSFLTVRDGADVTLRCESLIDGQEKCDGTSWIFSNSRSMSAVELIDHGQIDKESESKSDRLSVTENCSLVIKKVTAEDVGRYTCRQFDKSGRQQGRDNVVDLSVVTMTEQKDTDKLTLLCSLWTDGRCIYTVKWLLKGNDVDKDNKQLKTSQSPCNATLTFHIYHYIYSLRDKSFTCDVTNRDQRFTFTFQPTVKDKTPATTKPTRTTEKTTTGTRAGPDPPVNWRLWGPIAGTLSLAVLIITVVLVKRSKRRKGKKTQLDGNTGLSLNPAETLCGPEPSQDTADPEEGVSYASISYTKKPGGKAQVQNKDEDDAVTYSTVKVSSSSTGASTDASDLYATIAKPDQ